jgi:hypothetical protein
MALLHCQKLAKTDIFISSDNVKIINALERMKIVTGMEDTMKSYT